jgi:flavodoxin I
MKSLIVYSSQTGNTKKLAEAIYDTIADPKDIYPVASAPEADGYDFIAVGFWLLGGKPDTAASEYLAKLQKDNRANIFLFATHGAKADSDHVKNAFEQAKSLVPGLRIIGTYSCQGQLSEKIIEKLKTKPVPPPWYAGPSTGLGHPDDRDLDTLKNMIQKLL